MLVLTFLLLLLARNLLRCLIVNWHSYCVFCIIMYLRNYLLYLLEYYIVMFVSDLFAPHPFLPCPSLMCCAIVPKSFRDKGPHVRRLLVAHASSDGLLVQVFLSCKVNSRRSVHSPRLHFSSPLSLADRHDWRDTREKWPLAKNSDGSWWHNHTSINIFLAALHGSLDDRCRFFKLLSYGNYILVIL